MWLKSLEWLDRGHRAKTTKTAICFCVYFSICMELNMWKPVKPISGKVVFFFGPRKVGESAASFSIVCIHYKQFLWRRPGLPCRLFMFWLITNWLMRAQCLLLLDYLNSASNARVWHHENKQCSSPAFFPSTHLLQTMHFLWRHFPDLYLVALCLASSILLLAGFTLATLCAPALVLFEPMFASCPSITILPLMAP